MNKKQNPFKKGDKVVAYGEGSDFLFVEGTHVVTRATKDHVWTDKCRDKTDWRWFQKANKVAKKIKEENKKKELSDQKFILQELQKKNIQKLIDLGMYDKAVNEINNLPDSEQGAEAYHKWNKRGEGKTNLWVVFAVSIVGWVIGEILFVPFVSAIINSIN